MFASAKWPLRNLEFVIGIINVLPNAFCLSDMIMAKLILES